MDEAVKDSLVGFAQGGYLGRPTDDSLYMKGQTCGLVRSLLMYALESGYADRIVCVNDNPENPLRPVIDLFDDVGRIRNVTRSKYCPVNFGQAIKYIRQTEGKFVVVGLGCQIQGLNTAMEKYPLVRDRVKLTIGLFCDRILKYGAADFLVQRSGVNRESLRSFDFRHKEWHGYPGDIRIVDTNGESVNVDRVWRLRIGNFYIPVACRLCPNKLNVLSDVSVGDPWGVRSTQEIFSAVIARTVKGKEFLFEAQHAGKITLQDCDVKSIAQGQNVGTRLSNCVKYKQIMQKMGLEYPVALKAELFNVKQANAGLVDKMEFRFNLWSESSKGADFLNHLPLWLVYATALLKKINQFLIKGKGLIQRCLKKIDGRNH